MRLAAGTCKGPQHQLRNLSTRRPQQEKGKDGAPCMEARTAHASVVGILALVDMRVSIYAVEPLPAAVCALTHFPHCCTYLDHGAAPFRHTCPCKQRSRHRCQNPYQHDPRSLPHTLNPRRSPLFTGSKTFRSIDPGVEGLGGLCISLGFCKILVYSMHWHVGLTCLQRLSAKIPA